MATLTAAALVIGACGGDDSSSGDSSSSDTVPSATATGADLCDAFDVQAAAALFDDPDAPTDGWGGRPETDYVPHTCWVAVGHGVTTVVEVQFRQENLGGADGFDAVIAELDEGPGTTSASGVGDQTATYAGGVVFQSGDGVYVVHGPPSVETATYVDAAKIFAAGL